MAKSINRGFSLIEVLIMTALLGLLSLSLVHSAISMRTLLTSMEHQMDVYWQRQSLFSFLSADDMYQSTKLKTYSTRSFFYVDSDNDGKDDKWVEREFLHSGIRVSYNKSETELTWKDGQRDLITFHGRLDKAIP